MKLDTRQPVLKFQSGPEKFWKSLSAALVIGNHLWVGIVNLTFRKKQNHQLI
jgi:hypothetical protein